MLHRDKAGEDSKRCFGHQLGSLVSSLALVYVEAMTQHSFCPYPSPSGKFAFVPSIVNSLPVVCSHLHGDFLILSLREGTEPPYIAGVPGLSLKWARMAQEAWAGVEAPEGP